MGQFCRMSEKLLTPDIYLFIYLFIYLLHHACILWIQPICVGILWSEQRLLSRNGLCDIFLGICGVKVIMASVMAASNSVLVLQ
jgi:hypothetical protein